MDIVRRRGLGAGSPKTVMQVSGMSLGNGGYMGEGVPPRRARLI
jgi:hypothetical protein